MPDAMDRWLCRKPDVHSFWCIPLPAPGTEQISGESFFVPGKGYGLSLGAVVIAGGGSGLYFHADALRNRQLALRACLSSALTHRGTRGSILLCSLFGWWL